MVALLDALIKVEGADAYAVYQGELNERITKYNTIANQRAGEKKPEKQFKYRTVSSELSSIRI